MTEDDPQATLLAETAPKKGRNRGNAGKGRPKGAVNKTTREVREAFQRLLEDNADQLDSWLKRTAKKRPGAALAIVANLAEFVIPKLQRTELTGKNGEALRVTLVKGL